MAATLITLVSLLVMSSHGNYPVNISAIIGDQVMAATMLMLVPLLIMSSPGSYPVNNVSAIVGNVKS